MDSEVARLSWRLKRTTMPKRKRTDAAKKGWSKRRKIEKAPSNRPKTLRRWSNDSMLKAIEAVRSGAMGANRASRMHGVPASTLKDRLSGRVKHGAYPGPVPYLSREEEDELAAFLMQVSEIGWGKTKREVIQIVRQVLVKKGRDTESFNGEGWWLRFMERHPKLSL